MTHSMIHAMTNTITHIHTTTKLHTQNDTHTQ